MKKALIKDIYKKLFTYFGPQDWWPGDGWFEVAIGAILTQNTNWGNVEKAINNLKKQKLLSPKKLYSLSNKRLALLIRPAGYYNIKTMRLKAFLKFLFKFYRADIKKLSSSDELTLRRQLLSVNGIGEETADSILLYALDKPIFVIDAYTKRIFLRLGLIKNFHSYPKIQSLFMSNLEPNLGLFNEYHALIVKLGKEFCLKNNPRCTACPLSKNCRSGRKIIDKA